jgi:hypothetical protein
LSHAMFMLATGAAAPATSRDRASP